MHLHLPIPAEWRQYENDGRRWYMPHASNAVTLVVDPMEPFPPLRQPTWILERVRRDVPDGANLVVREVISETTSVGWPTNVLDIQIVDNGAAALGKSSASSSAQAGRLLEQRITTCYRFLEYCVIAEVRARDLAMLTELKDQLRALLAEGRPDWSGSDTSVRRLLDGITR